MITELPTRADFEATGIALLNLAWQSTLTLALKLVDARADEWDEVPGGAEEPDVPAGADIVALAVGTLLEAYTQVKGLERKKAELSLWAWYKGHAKEEREETIGVFTSGKAIFTKGQNLDTIRQYWEWSQQELATAVALAQQGTEFLLKGRIAEVSPFLLLSGGVREWPGGCDANDTSFSEFKTIDAQDLPRAHDTVCTPRLPPDFRERFEQLRRQRNSVMHTVNKRVQFTTKDGVLAILEVVHFLVGAEQWIRLRREYLDREPDLAPHIADDFRLCQMAREISYVIDLLEPAQVLRYFNFAKKQRRYHCPSCEKECPTGVKLAQLRPNTPASTSVFCALCAQIHAVVRQNCNIAGCPGNVIAVAGGLCLTCNNPRPAENGSLPVVPEGPEDPTQDEQPQDGDHRDRDRMPGRL